MIEIKQILCPVDFSEFSRRALAYAVALARWYGGRVVVLHVHPDLPRVDMIPSLAVEPARRIMLNEIERAAILEAERSLVRDATPGRVHVEAALEDGRDPHRAILEYASRLEADLIVMGSHGRSGYERLLLGSVAEKVLRKACCPVMIVPPHAEHPVPAGDPRFERILCPVDFSDGSLAALEYALSLATETRARLTLVNVIDVPAEMEGDSSLARLRGMVPESAGTVLTAVVNGRPWREIVRFAAERETDLIVMGVEGRGALDLMVFGSTTHRVLQAARCPVLTVRGQYPHG